MVLLGAFGTSKAQEPSGAAILQSCQVSDPNCMAYVNGITAGIVITQIAKEQGNPICLPDHISTATVREKIISFLSDNPKAQEVGANAAVEVALEAAFPCPKAN